MNGMDNWSICYVYYDGEYQWVEAGRNIVLNGQFDKVLPVREHVARQVDKLFFDGEKLKLKDGETLLSKTQLDQQQYESDLQNGLVVDESQSQIMEVEF